MLDYSKAIEINPEHYGAYYNRARSKAFLGDFYGSISDNTKSIEINSNNPLAFRNRAIDKMEIGDMKSACSDLRKASSLGEKKATKFTRSNY